LRIVMIGVAHWHTPFYSEPVLQMSDASIVGVSDPDPVRARPLAERARCPVFVDYREMCDKLAPDFAFVLGRHCDMADEARFLIDRRIAFAIEKPCALDADEASEIAGLARAAGSFAAVPLVMRYCPISPLSARWQRANASSICRSSSSAAWWTATTNRTCRG